MLFCDMEVEEKITLPGTIRAGNRIYDCVQALERFISSQLADLERLNCIYYLIRQLREQFRPALILLRNFDEAMVQSARLILIRVVESTRRFHCFEVEQATKARNTIHRKRVGESFISEECFRFRTGN